MKIVAIAFMVAGCTTLPGSDSDAGWLVGRWCPDGRSVYAGVEIGLWPTRFDADGRYSTFENEGVWQLAGEQLERVSDPPMPYRSVDRIERLGPDEMAWTMAHGEREIWHRCRESG